jgi:hypothetical protein
MDGEKGFLRYILFKANIFSTFSKIHHCNSPEHIIDAKSLVIITAVTYDCKYNRR